MFKDYNKYLSTSLKMYLFVLFIIFILKLVGIDYFALDTNNYIVLKLFNILDANGFLLDILNLSLFMFNHYIVLSITLDDNSKNMLLYNIFLMPIFATLQYFKLSFGNYSVVIELLYFIIVCFLYNYKTKKKIWKRFIFINLLIMIFQLVSMCTRLDYTIKYITNPIANLLLNLDYIIMLIIVYKINFMKGDEYKCSQEVQFSSLLKKTNLKKLLKKLQRNWHKFKQLPKQERLSISIYIFLSLLWNTFTVILVLFIAILNHSLVECIFILTSFWLSKHSFGRPFHLSSMMQCFVVSNLSYYILNRITTPLGISILIPILLGVGLSYVTSKLVKKTYKPLYKGMSKELFEETITKVTDKNSIKYRICYDFYIKGKSDVSLSFEYNYSLAGIRKIKNRINDNIRRLS